MKLKTVISVIVTTLIGVTLSGCAITQAPTQDEINLDLIALRQEHPSIKASGVAYGAEGDGFAYRGYGYISIDFTEIQDAAELEQIVLEVRTYDNMERVTIYDVTSVLDSPYVSGRNLSVVFSDSSRVPESVKGVKVSANKKCITLDGETFPYSFFNEISFRAPSPKECG